MTERNETAQPAHLGQVERGVGRPVPEREDARLLELAATAAGYTWRDDVAQQRGFEHVLGLWIPELTTLWNPLADSGYALDLAVKLRITVEQGDGWSDAGGWCTVYHSDHGGDACAATRRAIVRVAAELTNNKTPNPR